MQPLGKAGMWEEKISATSKTILKRYFTSFDCVGKLHFVVIGLIIGNNYY
jgi:hypothetical protein